MIMDACFHSTFLHRLHGLRSVYIGWEQDRKNVTRRLGYAGARRKWNNNFGQQLTEPLPIASRHGSPLLVQSRQLRKLSRTERSDQFRRPVVKSEIGDVIRKRSAEMSIERQRCHAMRSARAYTCGDLI